MKHPQRLKARVVVPMHSREILLPKTVAAILDQAGMSPAELVELL
jgi:predicted RNA binding protein YcfA (HicA-like mRNA interferase family)